MRKKKRAVVTLAIAGAIAVSGVGGLYLCMAKSMKDEKIILVEQKQQMRQTEQEQQTDKNETTQEVSTNQVWKEKESIYLPDGAEIVKNEEGVYNIVWDDYNIVFEQVDMGAKETKEDLGLAKLVPVIKDTIKKYSGQDMEKCNINIFINDLRYTVSNETGVDFNYISVEDVYGCKYEVKIGLGELSEDLASPIAYEARSYEVVVTGMPQHEYRISVDSVTGEIRRFEHYDDSLGEYSHGWKIENEGDVCELSEEEIKEYEDIMTSFVSEELKLGNVKKIYSWGWDLRFSEHNERAFYEVICETDDGTKVSVTIDCGEKTVQGFSINSLIEQIIYYDVCS